MTDTGRDHLRFGDPDGRWAAATLAELRDGTLEGRPHLSLACGHLSPRGNGPLAVAGYGYCDQHGVSRIVAATAED
jgi:hypothetical protein